MAQKVKFGFTSPGEHPQMKDIVGEGKKFLDDITLSIEGEAVFQSMGVSVDCSYLLEGVPGTGKTYAVQALNNTLNSKVREFLESEKMAKLSEKIQKAQKWEGTSEDMKKELLRMATERMKVVMLEYTIGRYGTAYINEGAKILQQFFDTGFAIARELPAMLVFDEADALMGARQTGIGNHREDDKNLQTLMTNLQEAQNTEHLFVILMTNFPRAIDPAMLRAGRINKRYHFKLPDKEGRKELFETVIAQRNAKAGYQVVRNCKTDKLSELTHGFSAADIDHCVKETIRKRAREVLRNRKNKVIPAAYVSEKRLENAIQKHRERFLLRDKTIGFKKPEGGK